MIFFALGTAEKKSITKHRVTVQVDATFKIMLCSFGFFCLLTVFSAGTVKWRVGKSFIAAMTLVQCH